PVRVVLVRVKPTPCRQQFDLRAFGDVSLHEVEHFHAAAYVGGHDHHADLGSAVQIQLTDLGHGHVEAPAQLGDHRSDHAALLLQRPNVTEQEVEPQRP